ncbi:MAG TPA: TIM barrel protein [Caldilineaceae bacterium]|nr:TIM barrel protein [Caldilineaceae bacterium]
MAEATVRLSFFGDEVADDLDAQLRVARDLKIGYLELRGVWGKNVLHLTDEEVQTIGQRCAAAGIAISAIGSPVGKSPLAQPPEIEQANLRRIFEIADRLGVRRVRVFSFYPPNTSSNAHYDQYVPDAAARLAWLTDMASSAGKLLLLENEKEIVGDTVARCHQLLTRVGSAHLQFAWDPANFVQVGEAQAVTDGWPLLGSYVAHVHVKDARLADGKVTPAGEGDGQVSLLLAQLNQSGFDGFLALEPHLAIAGHSSGFSGPEGMRRAAAALRGLMADVGMVESAPDWAQTPG